MLRDVIASHPRLFCPNETHFFRFADPYGTMTYVRPLINQKLFQEHRRLDTISDDYFRDQILVKSHTRRELMENYAAAYLNAQGAPKDARWFDKTPQNVFGALLLAAEFPESRFVHIVRHPLNVVSSLRTSKVMVIKEVVGAANYWYESTLIMKSMRDVVGDRLLEITYDQFTQNPEKELGRVMAFLGEDSRQVTYDLTKIKPEKNKYKTVLPAEDIEIAWGIFGDLAEEYGFHR